MGIYTFTAAITSQIAPAQIWAVLDDFARWPQWMPGLRGLRIDLLSAGAPKPGYRFRLVAPLIAADIRVEAVEPLERATSFKLSFPALTGSNRCHITPLPGGAYCLERRDELLIPDWLGAWLSTTQRTRFEQLAAEFLRALDDEARRRSFTPADTSAD